MCESERPGIILRRVWQTWSSSYCAGGKREKKGEGRERVGEGKECAENQVQESGNWYPGRTPHSLDNHTVTRETEDRMMDSHMVAVHGDHRLIYSRSNSARRDYRPYRTLRDRRGFPDGCRHRGRCLLGWRWQSLNYSLCPQREARERHPVIHGCPWHQRHREVCPNRNQ